MSNGIAQRPQYIVAGNFNPNIDNNLDLAVTIDSGVDQVGILFGNGLGGFAYNAANNVNVGNTPVALAAGFIDGDTNLDLAVSNSADNDVSILLGNGDGTFTSAGDVQVGNGPEGLILADFDNDGELDLAVANFFANTVSILHGDGTGGFDPVETINVGNGPISIAVGEFN